MDATVDTLRQLITVLERRRDQQFAIVDTLDLASLEGKDEAKRAGIAIRTLDTAIGDVRVFLNLAISEAKARGAVAA